MATNQSMRRVRRFAPHSRHTLQRWRSYLQTIFLPGDMAGLFMTCGLVVVVALALERANGLGMLAPISVLSIGLGFLFARSPFSEHRVWLMSSACGLFAVIAINTILIGDGSIFDRATALFAAIRIEICAYLDGYTPAEASVLSGLLISALFWLLGHNTAWHIFHVDRVWRAIIPIGMVLVVNQVAYQDDHALDIYLIVFVILALLLLIRSHVDTLEYIWFMQRVPFHRHVRRAFFRTGGGLAVLLVGAAWLAPTWNLHLGHRRLIPWSPNIPTLCYLGCSTLTPGGPVQLDDHVVMVVQVPYGDYYWQSTIYDTYDARSGAWSYSHEVGVTTYDPGYQFNTGDTLPGARLDVQQTFTLLMPASALIYAAPQPVRIGLPFEAELRCVEDYGKYCFDDNRQADVAVIHARKTLRKGDSYTVTSSVSTASDAMLRTAGRDYPSWVLRHYLQGAEDVSPRVNQLAAQIITESGVETPYDRVRAIEDWLRRNMQYNWAISGPPPGTNSIEWFLFESHEGYCTYYASAMVLMLRSQGVPARMAAGFAPGEWDAERGLFVVREYDAHTWVEVYFPGYGWVEFDPTSAGSLPPPSPVVTLTATPLPPPTATPAMPAPTLESGNENTTLPGPSSPPYQTPTPTPTETATVIPTLPPTPPPPGGTSGGMAQTLILLPALMMLVLGAVALLSVWFLEYRGLGRMNGTERAYTRIAIYARWLLGLRLDESATPDERCRYMATIVPEGERSIRAITRAYVENRYASPTPEENPVTTQIVYQAWQQARRVFLRHKFREFLADHTLRK